MEERLERALVALEYMYEQYCGRDGHLFMTAGEHASEVLELEGRMAIDETGRIVRPLTRTTKDI